MPAKKAAKRRKENEPEDLPLKKVKGTAVLNMPFLHHCILMLVFGNG